MLQLSCINRTVLLFFLSFSAFTRLNSSLPQIIFYPPTLSFDQFSPIFTTTSLILYTDERDFPLGFFFTPKFRHQITESRELGNGVFLALNAIIFPRCFHSQNFQTLAILSCFMAGDSHKVLTYTCTAIKLLVKAIFSVTFLMPLPSLIHLLSIAVI